MPFFVQKMCSYYLENQCHPTILFRINLWLYFTSLAFFWWQNARHYWNHHNNLITESFESSLKFSHWVIKWQLISSFLKHTLQFNFQTIRGEIVVTETVQKVLQNNVTTPIIKDSEIPYSVFSVLRSWWVRGGPWDILIFTCSLSAFLYFRWMILPTFNICLWR